MGTNNKDLTPEELIEKATHLDPTLNQEMVPKSVALQAINLARLQVLLDKVQSELKNIK